MTGELWWIPPGTLPWPDRARWYAAAAEVAEHLGEPTDIPARLEIEAAFWRAGVAVGAPKPEGVEREIAYANLDRLLGVA